MKKSLVLTGMMGVGKSTIGKLLAKRLKVKFIDVDKVIERNEKKSIKRVFEENGEKYFHMKNTLIPLDVAFINEEGVVVNIKELHPLRTMPVSSDCDALYAIEVNRGWFEKNNVRIGDKVLDI